MANERDRTGKDRDMGDQNIGGGSDTPQEERLRGESEEVRGIADETDDDFEDAEDLDEEEDETDGTI